MKIIDISPALTSQIAVWPGDTPFERKVLMSIHQGANIELSTLHSTVHLGAHADAPVHYHKDGASIGEVALEPYLGECFVVHAKGEQLISAKTVERALKFGCKRILFRTDSFPNPNYFNENFSAFDARAVDLMGQNKILLIGIDTPSVDPFDSKDLPAHQMLMKYQIRNLEGLVLSHVEEGAYELIALPLKLNDFDASPVRAILRTLK